MIAFLNFDGSSTGILPAGFSNTTISGHTGNYKVGTVGSISSPNSLYDSGGQPGGSAVWTGFLAADEAIQFDQIVNLSGGVMNPLVRMSSTAPTGYGAFINWTTPKIDFVAIAANGTVSTLASPAIPAFANGAKVTVKLEIQGHNLRFKAWLTSTTEPTSWTATTTDSTYSAAGYAGFSNGGGSADNVYFGPAGSTFSGGFLAPTLSTSAITAESVTLAWTKALQSGGSVAYQLERSPHGANTFANVSGGTASPFLDSSVVPGASYDYRVVASDGINTSVASNVISVTMEGTANAFVHGSGQSIGFRFSDSSGNPTAMSSLGSFSDIQTLTVNGEPTANRFLLSVGSQTTSEISSTILTQTLPTYYALWTVPVTPGQTYQAAIDFHQNSASLTALRVCLIDGISGGNLGAILASRAINLVSGSADYTVTGLAGNGGNLGFSIIGQATPSQSSLLILLTADSGSSGNHIDFSVCGVAPVTSGTVGTSTYYDINDGGYFTSNANGSVVVQFDCTYYNCQHYNLTNYTGTPIFSTLASSTVGPAVTLSASAIQSALTALSNVGSGNLLVTDQSGQGTGPFTLASQGALANASLPTITSNSSAITIAHTHVGGQYPTISINGGSAITLNGVPYWGETGSPYCPFALWPLPQSSPDVAYYPWGQVCGATNSSGGQSYNFFTAAGNGYSGNPAATATPGVNLTINIEGLQPGTYQLAATWPISNASGVVYTIQALNSTGSAGASVVSIGSTLGTYTANQTIAPSSFAASGVEWQTLGSFTIAYPCIGFAVTATCPSSGTIIMDAIQVQRTSANNSVQIHPGDSVTMTLASGVFTTVAGSVPGFTNQVIPNLTGQSGIPSIGVTPSMEVGYNLEFDLVNYGSNLVYTNLALRADWVGAGATAIDSIGNPTASASGQLGCAIVGTSPLYPYGCPTGINNAPNGYYTLRWTGSSLLNLVASGSTTVVEVLADQSINAGGSSVRVFNIQSNPYVSNAPTFGLTITNSGGTSGAYTYNVSNISLVPPNPADSSGMTPWLTGVPKYHPGFVNMIRPAKRLRFLNWLGINNSNIGQYSDYRTAGQYAQTIRTVSSAVTSYTAPATPYWSPNYYDVVQLNLATPLTGPNELTSGMIVSFTIPSTATFTDGSSVPAGTYQGPAYVVSSTVIQVAVSNSSSGTSRSLSSPVSGGSMSCSVGQDVGVLTDIFEICNLANFGLGADCHLNLPIGCTSTLAGQIGTAALALNSSSKLCLELANEVWNYGFKARIWYEARTYQLNAGAYYLGNYFIGFVADSLTCWEAIESLWTAAGRSGQIRRLLPSQAAFSAVTTDLANAAQAASVTFHELPVAPYFLPWYQTVGIEPNFQEFYDLATTGPPYGGQAMDFLNEMLYQDTCYSAFVKAHAEILQSSTYGTPSIFTNVAITCYESGIQQVVPGQSVVNGFGRTYALLYHPRIYAGMQAYLANLQTAECTATNIFELISTGLTNGSSISGFPFTWPVYSGFNQGNGTGSISNDTVNANNPTNFATVLSEVGGAIASWNALLPKPTPHNSPSQLGTTGKSKRIGRHVH